MEAATNQNDATSAVNHAKEKQKEVEVSKENPGKEVNSKNMTAETAESFQGLAERQQPEDSDAQEVINHIENNETKEKENMGKVFECGKEEKPNEDDKGKAADTENENDAKSREEASKGQQNEDSNEDGLKEDENSATTVVDSDKSGNVSGDKSVQTPSVDATLNKKIKKKDKSSAEEKKLVDLLVHVFDGLETPEKKMEALAKKYIQLAADMKTTESKLDDVEGKHREVKREKEQLQNDFGKVNMAKTKLESLCRELQKQNKIIKEEIQKRSDEEDRKRRELSQKFQSTINDITTQMGENHKRNQQLKQDNTDLAQKLKGLVEQYEVREQHIEKVLKAKQLELQLCEAKLQQQSNILQEERQNHLKEKHVLLTESLEQEKKVEMLVKQEAELKGQLSLYTEKFVEFQSTLTKSNEVFATFKKEMDKMTKTIRKLEKESNTWKTRYENTNVSLVQMVEERTQKDNDILVQKGKVEKLEKLCRALQAERRKLKKELEHFEKPKTANNASSEEIFSSNGNPHEGAVSNEVNGSCVAEEKTSTCQELSGDGAQEIDGNLEEKKNEKSIVDGIENDKNNSEVDGILNEVSKSDK